MTIFTRMGRTLLIAAVGAVCLSGCGGGDEGNPTDNNNNSNNDNGVVVGTFVDGRDGKTYKKVKIGGKTWMGENLNYNTADGSGSWCYNNSTDSCAKYGRLYNWNTAMGGLSSTTANPSGVKGVCPNGWHLPSRAEWDVLMDLVGDSMLVDWTYGSDTAYYWPGTGTELKSQTGWNNNGNGMDTYGFSALPGGVRTGGESRYSDGSFIIAGEDGVWWTATENDSGIAYYRDMNYDHDYVYEHYYLKSDAFSVRCVAD